MRFTSILSAVVALAVSAVPMMGQAAKTSGNSATPRTVDGHPDLQGIYDLATMTPLERFPGDPPVLTKEQADKLQQKELARRAERGDKLDPNRPKELPVGGDTTSGHSFFEILEKAGGGAVGGYDANTWLNQGTSFFVVDGQVRTSIVIDPPNGHIPPFNDKAKARRASAMRVLPTSDQGEQANRPARRGENDDPEQLPLSLRCILGFGSTAGPPALPDYFYNDLHQIVQTKDSVLIVSEMIHDARVVRMNQEHLPQYIRRWMGDSVGHWDGDTLVIDTTNFTDKTRFHGSTENLHIVERIKRVDAKTLLYRFTVEDPETWDQSWTGEMAWPLTDKPMYEYACHEGNYALGDVLRGARRQEAAEDSAKDKH